MLSAPTKANNSNGDDLPKLTTAATIASSATASIIASNIEEYGVTKGGAKMMKCEALAAQESIVSGIYIVWVPHPSCKLTVAASDGSDYNLSEHIYIILRNNNLIQTIH